MTARESPRTVSPFSPSHACAAQTASLHTEQPDDGSPPSSQSDRTSCAPASEPISDYEKRQHAAGFFDCNACVKIGKAGAGKVSVVFSQSSDDGVPPVLERLRALFGGQLHSQKRRGWQREHTLSVASRDCVERLLAAMADCCLAKGRQVAVARLHLGHLADRGRYGERAAPCTCADYLGSMKRDRDACNAAAAAALVDAPNRLTDAYVAGMFDAAGAVAWRPRALGPPRAQLSITRARLPLLIQAIAAHLGGTSTVSARRGSVTFSRLVDVDAVAARLQPFAVRCGGELAAACELCRRVLAGSGNRDADDSDEARKGGEARDTRDAAADEPERGLSAGDTLPS